MDATAKHGPGAEPPPPQASLGVRALGVWKAWCVWGGQTLYQKGISEEAHRDTGVEDMEGDALTLAAF